MTEHKIQERMCQILRSCYTIWQYNNAAQWIERHFKRKEVEIPAWIRLEMTAAFRQCPSHLSKQKKSRQIKAGELSL